MPSISSDQPVNGEHGAVVRLRNTIAEAIDRAKDSVNRIPAGQVLLEMRDGKLFTGRIFRLADSVAQEHHATARRERYGNGVEGCCGQHPYRHVTLFDETDVTVGLDQKGRNVTAVHQFSRAVMPAAQGDESHILRP